MLANILYILSVVLPIVTAWVIDAHKKLEAQKVIEEAGTVRARMSYDAANTRAKTKDHDQALENALLEIETLRSRADSQLAAIEDHTKQLSALNDRL